MKEFSKYIIIRILNKFEMDFNSIVYPAPEPTSDVNFFLESEDPEMRKMLLLIDHDNDGKN